MDRDEVRTRRAQSGSIQRGTAQAGFTLIELIVVIVIMALVAGLVMVQRPFSSPGLNANITERALSGALRLARSRAIVQNKDVVVVTNPRGFSVDGGNVWTLPRDQSLSPAEVVFTPDGGSTGGTILLEAAGRQTVIDINWLTGRVRVR